MSRSPAAALNYSAFVASKSPDVLPAGYGADLSASMAYPFQRATIEWALRMGRCAIFADTGLGKTLMQLEWASAVAGRTGAPVLLLTPLAVAEQTMREARKFGVAGTFRAERGEDVSGPGVWVTNYERLHLFDGIAFGGVVLDESSILKSYMGKTKRALIDRFADTPYRLACTATPAPNDHMEIGNHSEFLGVMDSHRMLARWFISDQSEAGVYRLKGHARRHFWDWVTSWAVCVGKPSDMGEYDDDGYNLPPLTIHRHTVAVDLVRGRGDKLFRSADLSATGLHREKRQTVPERAAMVRDLVWAEPGEHWICWCDTNYEQDELRRLFHDAIDVRGADSASAKATKLLQFSDKGGVILTKPGIAGMGLNWQHAARQAFVGLSYSYERLYQAIRRSWRFGQDRPVDVHVVSAATEAPIWQVIDRKRAAHEEMKLEMFAAQRRAVGRRMDRDPYTPNVRAPRPDWFRSYE